MQTETLARTATVTREPEHAGYDTLGDADNWGEDFYLLVDGERIGGTYWCSARYIKDGERWASYGPAGLQMGFRTREDAEQAQVDTHLSNESARAADRAVSDAFANRLREMLALTPDTPRFHQGRDLHLRADRLIRLAHRRVQDPAPLEGDEVFAAGFSAACAWRRFIYREQATDTVLEYVQNLSPWQFCQFLGDLVVADARTGKEQDAYFCALATRLDTAARAADTVATVDVERLAQQHTEILRLAFTPYLADPVADLTIAPYSVWITYRREADATDTTWEAVVSGNRVLRNGVVDMDADSITLRSVTDQDVTPDWLAGLIEVYAPGSW
jgi:hypothetical protein